jgi:hypothetical protein
MTEFNYSLDEKKPFPIRWAAPEVLAVRKVLKPSDVWSFGVVM